MGISYPGSSNAVANNIDNLNPVVGSSIVIQTDAGYMSTLSAAPQNVFRLTATGGASYIQGANIRFSMPFSGAAGVAILPSTGTVNLTSMNFLSSINSSAGVVNWNQLASTIKGNGWADVV